MLQWMGGSRRKVTTSRTSTHKRQKQYFEQRKRHYLHHTAGNESYTDGRHSYTENNRSLDILSLENVATVAQELTASCINEDKPEECDFTSNHQYVLPYEAVLVDETLPEDRVQVNEEGTPLHYGTEAGYSQKVPTPLQDQHEILLGDDNLDPFKLSATLSEVSVIDLLSDRRSRSKAEEGSAHVHEAHVSFSVEGLGKVESETPVQSPRIHGRSFPNYLSPRQKARRQPLTSRHIDYSFHDPMAQVDFEFSPYSSSSIEQTFCSKEMMNIIGDPNLMFSNRNCSSPFIWDSSNSQGAFDNDELIFNIRESERNIWNGPRLLDARTDDLGEHEIFCKNWADRNVPLDDYFHDNDTWKQGFNFDSQSLLKRRFSPERFGNFDIRASTVAYSKHQSIEDLSDKISNTRNSAIRIDNDIKDAVNHFAREDNRESMSLLSEESCSSTAVRGDAARKS